MSEGSEHAAILMATSFQALNRAVNTNPDTLLTDCTVLVLFAGFFVEATLNHIIEQTGKDAEFRIFPVTSHSNRKKNFPGLKDKLGWFYNEFVDHSRFTNWRDIYSNGIDRKLDEKFPGFTELYTFRNDISHGKINQSAKSLEIAQQLRIKAKEIVNQLYRITADQGYIVARDTKYSDALVSFTNNKKALVSESSAS